MAKILRQSLKNNEAQFPKFCVFIARNRYFVIIAFKMLKIEFKFNINNKIVTQFGQFILIKVKKNSRKSRAQFREKLRKLRLKQNNDFVIKSTCIPRRGIPQMLKSCPNGF